MVSIYSGEESLWCNPAHQGNSGRLIWLICLVRCLLRCVHEDDCTMVSVDGVVIFVGETLASADTSSNRFVGILHFSFLVLHIWLASKWSVYRPTVHSFNKIGVAT